MLVATNQHDVVDSRFISKVHLSRAPRLPVSAARAGRGVTIKQDEDHDT